MVTDSDEMSRQLAPEGTLRTYLNAEVAALDYRNGSMPRGDAYGVFLIGRHARSRHFLREVRRHVRQFDRRLGIDLGHAVQILLVTRQRSTALGSLDRVCR